MLPYLRKAFGKCLYDQIYAHTEKWRCNLDQGDISVILFTDLSKDFDCSVHDFLMVLLMIL